MSEKKIWYWPLLFSRKKELNFNGKIFKKKKTIAMTSD
jgi:hypothetical protein